MNRSFNLQKKTTRNSCTYKEPGGFLLEGDLELAALRPRRLGALAVECVALMNQLQLVLEQRDLVVEPPASLRIATTARTHSNSVPSQVHKSDTYMHTHTHTHKVRSKKKDANLVEVEEDVVERLLRLVGAPAAQRLDGLDGLLGAVLLLHHDGHVLERAVHAVAGVDRRPEQRDSLLRVLVH